MRAKRPSHDKDRPECGECGSRDTERVLEDPRNMNGDVFTCHSCGVTQKRDAMNVDAQSGDTGYKPGPLDNLDNPSGNTGFLPGYYKRKPVGEVTEGLSFDKFMDATLIAEAKTQGEPARQIHPQRQLARSYQEHPLGKTRIGRGGR